MYTSQLWSMQNACSIVPKFLWWNLPRLIVYQRFPSRLDFLMRETRISITLDLFRLYLGHFGPVTNILIFTDAIEYAQSTNQIFQSEEATVCDMWVDRI